MADRELSEYEQRTRGAVSEGSAARADVTAIVKAGAATTFEGRYEIFQGGRRHP